jgi:cytochrome c oxidase accessory protein FixG
LFLTSIVLFTTVFGRLWCGWACPQTVMMEMVFRKLDYLIEGDAHQQRALDAGPWTAGKLAKKTLKHVLYLGLSFIIGNTLLAYIIGSDGLLAIQVDDPRNHLVGLSFMILFTLLFYSIFARFREQACTFICPYGRFQSAMVDENTMVVAYDDKRGEQRGVLRREQSFAERQAAGNGDCISCRQCVVVCPTGIDIRNGVQMECVHCTACIDACDAVMDKIKRPRGLIRYASLNSIEKGLPLKFTARMGIYSVLLTVLVVALGVLVFTRSDVETLFLRAPGGMFTQLPDGRFQNLYTVKIVNKTSREIPIALKPENFVGEITTVGALNAPPQELVTTSVLVKLESSRMTGANTRLTIGVYSGDRLIETVDTAFIGPRSSNPNP